MYHPTSRVLAVLELLQSYKCMTGVELARRLEVNVRTLRRYITMLQDLGIPIIAERGRSGAYSLGAGYRLPPMMFTNEEALALEIGLLAAAQHGLTEQVSAIESARAKLEYVMPPDLKRRARAVSETIRLDVESFATPPSSRVMLVLSSATQLKQRVHLQYQADRDDITERDFDSYGITCRRGRWYTVGWCHLRQAVRSFRMDRIVEAALTGVEFVPPADFDVLLHLEQSIATMPRPYPFEVLLKTDMLTAQRRIFDTFGVLEAHEEGVLLRGSAEELPWVAQQLAVLPFAFVIHEPVQLRQALRDHAAQLVLQAGID